MAIAQRLVNKNGGELNLEDMMRKKEHSLSFTWNSENKTNIINASKEVL